MAILSARKSVKRAFVGMAGSPLAKANKLFIEKSDNTLRVPKTPDREEPIAFDTWIDEFEQKHGEIDLDCAFQECAFDPHLGHGANPLENSELPSHAGAERPDEYSPLQDLGLSPTSPQGTGLLEGDRQIKRRRPGAKTWWIFNSELFKGFLQSKYDPANPYEAEKAALVLHLYYYQNRDDEDIHQETAWFEDVKKIKQYRQYLAKQGAQMFADLKPESTWYGRRRMIRGSRCDNPNCTQCKANEKSVDFSGRYQ